MRQSLCFVIACRLSKDSFEVVDHFARYSTVLTIMGRIMIKGGVWRNTEDEVLKAAVMKYGKNQWSRIASVLHRKSAKQCKARWYEWLDPSIKKTEWSREEEEKLLHLAKLMPTQWRTIASIVGRTASQCLEHYEQLLDQAAKKDDPDAGPSDDPRKLKPGEIDPNPETKPARPDPKDMDEDELEMLSEARARLANTQGKKAKRKAREKQLEEARRLASLQKRRELRMAGINIGIGSRKKNRRKRGMDYNEEIPFYKPVPAGFHDVSDEQFVPPTHDFKRLRQNQLDGEFRAEKEEKERKKDKEKLKKRKEEGDLPPIIMKDNQTRRERGKLILPQPQVSDAELEQVIKLGRASETAKDVVEENELLGDYSVTSAAAINSIRTPKTSLLSRDNILLEAQNILALQNVETPLKGGENTPLHVVEGFGSSVVARTGQVTHVGLVPTPALPGTSKVLQTGTPNALIATPFRTPAGEAGQEVSKTPSVRSVVPGTPSSVISGSSVMSTPLRDKLAINPESSLAFHDPKQIKADVRSALSSLPKPKNEYEIVVNHDDEDMRDEKEEDPETLSMRTFEDQADLDAKKEAEEEARRQLEFRKQSQAVQRDLPRPVVVTESILKDRDVQLTELQEAEEMIKQEMLVMLHHDALKNPTIDQLSKPVSSDVHSSFLARNPYQEVNLDDLEKADELLKEEASLVKKKMAHGDIGLDSYTTVWEECLSQVLFLKQQGKVVRSSHASKKDQKDALERKLECNRASMGKKAKKAAQLEKKLKITLGGYQTRAASLTKGLAETQEQVEQNKIQVESFKRLQEIEESAITRRVGSLQEDVSRQVSREKVLQTKYDSLIRRKQDLESVLLEQRMTNTVSSTSNWLNYWMVFFTYQITVMLSIIFPSLSHK